MIEFLVLQIKLGKITIEDVPPKYKEDVEKAISNMGGGDQWIT